MQKKIFKYTERICQPIYSTIRLSNTGLAVVQEKEKEEKN